LENEVIHKGGPVSDTSILLLHTSEWTSTNTITATDEVCMTSDSLMLEKLAMGNAPHGWRMFAGMSLWQTGQLEDEIARGGWLIAEANNHSIGRHLYEKLTKIICYRNSLVRSNVY
jgi:putative AlgH/UPF0301 family transcriptional regulator